MGAAHSHNTTKASYIEMPLASRNIHITIDLLPDLIRLLDSERKLSASVNFMFADEKGDVPEPVTELTSTPSDDDLPADTLTTSNLADAADAVILTSDSSPASTKPSPDVSPTAGIPSLADTSSPVDAIPSVRTAPPADIKTVVPPHVEAGAMTTKGAWIMRVFHKTSLLTKSTRGSAGAALASKPAGAPAPNVAGKVIAYHAAHRATQPILGDPFRASIVFCLNDRTGNSGMGLGLAHELALQLDSGSEDIKVLEDQNQRDKVSVGMGAKVVGGVDKGAVNPAGIRGNPHFGSRKRPIFFLAGDTAPVTPAPRQFVALVPNRPAAMKGTPGAAKLKRPILAPLNLNVRVGGGGNTLARANARAEKLKTSGRRASDTPVKVTVASPPAKGRRHIAKRELGYSFPLL
ncbi:hypothetical protein IAT38_006164 [Cryptococcus sp. DSM 104549]